MKRFSLLALLLFLLTACDGRWNDPYPAADGQASVLYSVFTEPPKHLDPVQSYSENEVVFTAQIYEPPLQYHYLKRPYEVVPLAAQAVPDPIYLDKNGRRLPRNAPAEKIAYTDYVVTLKPGIRYQPHPAFAAQPARMGLPRRLSDFPATGSRLLSAADYVYEIKRLASPRLHSPILGLMGEYIVGLPELAKTLGEYDKAHPADWLDLRQFDLPGAQVLDAQRFRVRVRGKYPQFIYWLTMPFFAPIPWEADRFYSQPGMAERNLTLDWYPVGTGPYYLSENDPNRRMVLSRNPNYRGEPYPCEGEAEDRAQGLLADCGKATPFIDQVIFTREKEAVPYWNKFRQGYYDASGISNDNFDQAVNISASGDAALTDDMQQQGISLTTSVATSTMYIGFNLLDPVVGGLSDKGRKLRQAISIAVDEDEYVSIFANGRGVVAHGPIPPGIFGQRSGEAGLNPQVYRWEGQQAVRRSLDDARRLLAEAGYPQGRDAKTGAPLVIYLDTTLGGAGSKASADWLIKQFAKLDIQLEVRSTDWNRLQEKLIKGNTQMYYAGWNADYPDPENFLFLLYGPQGKVKHQGENYSNYQNPEYDRLFEQMRAMDNGPARQQVIDRMVTLLREDAPWIWGFHPVDYVLAHQWLSNRKPSKVGHNGLQFQRVDGARREALRAEWNPPARGALLAALGILLLLGLLVHQAARRLENRKGREC